MSTVHRKEIMQLHVTLAILLGITGVVVQAQEQLNEYGERGRGKPIGWWERQNLPAGQQKENASGRVLTKNIRSAIVKDKSLSSQAHSIMVLRSWHGTVTLKGPVFSEDEKRAVEMKATEIAGADNVNTEIFVKTDVGHPK
jgi:osmotically-inducible protein OsmY